MAAEQNAGNGAAECMDVDVNVPSTANGTDDGEWTQEEMYFMQAALEQARAPPAAAPPSPPTTTRQLRLGGFCRRQRRWVGSLRLSRQAHASGRRTRGAALRSAADSTPSSARRPRPSQARVALHRREVPVGCAAAAPRPLPRARPWRRAGRGRKPAAGARPPARRRRRRASLHHLI
jgi:hypothetical protein